MPEGGLIIKYFKHSYCKHKKPTYCSDEAQKTKPKFHAF